MDTQLVKNYRKILEQKFQNFGLTLVEYNDFDMMDRELIRCAEEVDLPVGPSPMFSSKFNVLTPDRSFWYALKTADGEMVCAVAAKKFDYVDDLETMWNKLRFFYDDESKPVPADQLIVDTVFPVELEGTMSITGRGWTRRDYRRRGLVRDLVILARAECLSRWLVDWHLGTTTAGHIGGGREASCFGYDPEHNVDRLGFYLKPVGIDKTVHLHLLWMGPEDIVGLVEGEIERLSSDTGLVAAE